MKAVSFSSTTNRVVLALVACMPVLAGAATQSVIASAGEPYLAKPEIKFVIDVVEAKPVEARAALPAPSSEVFLSPPVEVITPPVVAPPSFELVKGKRVDDQLRAYGKSSGWGLIWQAPEFVLDQNMMIPGDFESAVLFFLNGANEAGARLRAVFYRGNKTVRVTEF